MGESVVVYRRRHGAISSSVTVPGNPLKRKSSCLGFSGPWCSLEKIKPIETYRRRRRRAEPKHGEQARTISCNFEFEMPEDEPPQGSASKRSRLDAVTITPISTKHLSSAPRSEKASQSSEESMDLNGSLLSSRCVEPGKTLLVDAQMIINASYRNENVPFDCLTSKINGEAILGHPLQMEELPVVSETMLPGKETVTVRKASKRTRTPVCYITNSLPPPRVTAARGNVQIQMVEEESQMKLLKKTKGFGKGEMELGKTCVPVGLVFCKILAAMDDR